MSKQVNMHEAKTKFCAICREAESGVEVVIARSGKAIVKLVKIDDDKPISRKLGGLAHLREASSNGFDDEIADSSRT
jgi:antitoxin (DNA-binding transcriptional repressor) of toxin-antitoxin stability system